MSTPTFGSGGTLDNRAVADPEDYTRARGRGRSDSFVNELEEEETRSKERQLLEKLDGGGRSSSVINRRQRGGMMSSYDSMEDFEPVKTQLSQKTLDIVTKLDHRKVNTRPPPANKVELFPHPVVVISREEAEEEIALEEENIVYKIGSPVNTEASGGIASGGKVGGTPGKKKKSKSSSKLSEAKELGAISAGNSPSSASSSATLTSSPSTPSPMSAQSGSSGSASSSPFGKLSGFVSPSDFARKSPEPSNSGSKSEASPPPKELAKDIDDANDISRKGKQVGLGKRRKSSASRGAGKALSRAASSFKYYVGMRSKKRSESEGQRKPSSEDGTAMVNGQAAAREEGQASGNRSAGEDLFGESTSALNFGENLALGDIDGASSCPSSPTAKQRDEHFDFHVKVLLLGDSGVGKTSLMMRFSDNEFNQNLMSTAGVDFKVRYLEDAERTAGKRIKCQIWDTAGQERFHVITRTYYRGSHCIALVYDATNEQSFEQINYWMKNIKNHAGKEVSVGLFGNKIDLPNRLISYEQGKAVADQHGCLFYETSAKDGTNVLDAFQALSMGAVKNLVLKESDQVERSQGHNNSAILETDAKQKCSIL